MYLRFPTSTKGDNICPISNLALGFSLNSAQPLFCVSGLLWQEAESEYAPKFTATIYQQVNCAHRLNRNILSRSSPSGADGKGNIGRALSIVGLHQVWQITLPLSNERLTCSRAATSKDENVWITLLSVVAAAASILLKIRLKRWELTRSEKRIAYTLQIEEVLIAIWSAL